MKIAQALKVPIITYHSIDESKSVISTAPQVFEWQMKILSESGYSVISLRKCIKLLNENKKLAPKTVILTFDDGFQNFYTTAFPVLEKYGFSATVFLVTNFCEKYNDWAGNPPELPRSKLLSWREIRELDDLKIEFGAHTQTHPDLSRLSAKNAMQEIIESKLVIEEKLGKKVETFAYPYGKFNAQTKKIVAKEFAAACSTNLGKIKPASDLFLLERIDSYYLSNKAIFNSLSSKTFDYYLFFRQVLRHLKISINRN